MHKDIRKLYVVYKIMIVSDIVSKGIDYDRVLINVLLLLCIE